MALFSRFFSVFILLLLLQPPTVFGSPKLVLLLSLDQLSPGRLLVLATSSLRPALIRQKQASLAIAISIMQLANNVTVSMIQMMLIEFMEQRTIGHLMQ